MMLTVRNRSGGLLTVVDSVAYSLVREGSATWPGDEPDPSPVDDVDDVDDAAVREWAHANDIPVNSRGRVPKNLVERYRASEGKAGSASS